MRGGYYRPAYFHTLKAGLDASGNIVGWQHRIVGQSILAGTPFEAMMVKDGIDRTSRRRRVDAAVRDPEPAGRSAFADGRRAGAVVALGRLDAHRASRPRRSSTSSRAAAGKDPVAFRRALLAKHPRHWACSNSRRARPAGARRSRRARPARSAGAASRCTSRSTPSSRRSPRSRSTRTASSSVDRVVCAVDCGIAVNPDVIRAQMEGGIGFGLSAALYGAITLKDGVVEQSNFHDYPVLRINEMPAVEVHIVPSTREAHRRRRARRAADRAGGRQRARRCDRQRLRVLPLKLA